MKNYIRHDGLKTKTALAGLSLASVLLVAACGTLEVRDLKDTFGKKNSVSGSDNGDMVSVNLGVSASPDLASQLLQFVEGFYATTVPSQSFYYKVTGCKSGFSISTPAEVTSNSGTVKLYKFDKDCLVGLVSFNYASKTYVPTSGSEFSGTENSTALFKEQNDPADLLKIKVMKQLPNGANSTGVIDGSGANFSFMKAKSGGAANLVRYSSGVGLSVNGVESPNVSAIDLEITNIGTDGKAEYKATMTCGNPLVAVGGTNQVCPHTANASDEQLISHMQIKIITRSPTNKTTYSVSDLDTIMASGTQSISGSAKSAASAFTVTGLAGEGVFTSNKNLLVIISYTEPSTNSQGTSYIYYTADYGTPDASP
jgi:hypothetical protein